MSMSSPGDVRRPSTKKVANPAAGAGKKPGGAGGSSGGKKPAGGAGGKGRRPLTPVKVSQGRNWGPIALYVTTGVVALGIIAFATVYLLNNKPDTRPWKERAADIAGIVDYTKTQPDLLKPAQHVNGSVTYPQSPPVGGQHNPVWQNCMGNVYTQPLANEHAVHSLEHGTVWITYNPDKLGKDDVAKLEDKVKGTEYTMISPYPGLDSPISLQTWGYQLKLTSASDARIDKFIQALRENASQEKGASCSGGITEPGLHDIQKVDPSASTDATTQ
jgi:hypothetical protein